MIGFLRGTLQSKEPEALLVDVGGVGYLVTVPLSTYYELPDSGGTVQIRIHTHVREEAIELYGFNSAAEHKLFRALIGINGIGPKLAITILSGMESDVLAAAIADQDVPRLTSIPGVGKKTAERLVLELKDKVLDVAPAARPMSARGVRDDVVSALLNLGYKQRDAERALDKVDDASAPFDALLRQTLRMLAR